MTKKRIRRDPNKKSVKKEKYDNKSNKGISEKIDEFSKLISEKDDLLEKLKLFASNMPKSNVYYRNMSDDDKANLDWAANAE